MDITAQDIFVTINKIRENPSLVVNEVKDQLKRFQSNSVYRTKRDIKIRTVSGKAGWQDTVLALQRQKSKGNLQWNSLLAKAVEEYVEVSAQDDSINPFDVIRNFCSYEGNISFNVNESDTEQDLMQLAAAMVIGDGDEKKGSRIAIFHPLFRQFACAVRKRGNRNTVFTIFSESVTEPTNNNPSSPKKTQNMSSWEDKPLGNHSNMGNNSKLANNSNLVNKYKPQEEENNTKESLMRKGKQLIAQLNKVRKEPKQYVHALKAEIQKFKDDKTINADHGVIVTKEGQVPYYDLISQLQSQYPLPTIREVTGLTLVAIEQLIEADSMVQYKVPVENLLDKFCTASEGIRSIKLRDVEGMPISAMLMRLLVGDGDRKRTGRRKLLSPVCKAVGCGISKNMLIINVGESAKDNREMVEGYMESICQQMGSGSKSRSNKEKGVSSKQYVEYDNSPRFGGNSKDNYGSGDRFVIKKTSKSRHQKKNGRVYVVTQIQAIYNDGHIEKVVQQELVR